MGENAIGSIQWPIHENPPINAKISQISRTQTEFCLKFCFMATCVDRKICSLQHSMAHTQNPLATGAKNRADIFYKSRVITNFVPNFVGTPPYRQKRKNFAKISYSSQIIAYFVLDISAMATGSVGKKCNWQHSMAHHRKTINRCKNLAKIFYASQVIANFCPKFRCHGNGGRSEENSIGSIRWPVP